MAGTQTYEVDVEGKTYEVDAPDEATAWRWANHTHVKTGASSAFNKQATISLARGENPILAKAADFAAGASGVMRGTANLAGSVFGKEKLGETIWPTEGTDKNSWTHHL